MSLFSPAALLLLWAAWLLSLPVVFYSAAPMFREAWAGVRQRRIGMDLPVSIGIALTFVAPLIALLLAALFLDERVGSRSLIGSALAFGGVVVIVFGQARASIRPDVLLGTAAIMGSALCYAANIVMMRHQALAARPFEINFFQSLTASR